MKIDCKNCLFMIQYEDERKWSEPIACGYCGRTKEELIYLQRDYEDEINERPYLGE